jgi:hypothetical protein
MFVLRGKIVLEGRAPLKRPVFFETVRSSNMDVNMVGLDEFDRKKDVQISIAGELDEFAKALESSKFDFFDDAFFGVIAAYGDIAATR